MHNASTNRARYQPGKVSTGQRPPCEHADLADTGPVVVLIQTLRVFALQKPLTTCHPHFKGPTPGAVQLPCAAACRAAVTRARATQLCCRVPCYSASHWPCCHCSVWACAGLRVPYRLQYAPRADSHSWGGDGGVRGGMHDRAKKGVVSGILA